MKGYLDNVQNGDITYFQNNENYSKFHGEFGGMVGEWVTKVGDDSYIGFGFSDSKSYEGWLDTLRDHYNSGLKERDRITYKGVKGYWGRYRSLNFFQIAQDVFDLRTGKK
jgi:hypothetical protein